ncbi:MAG TPA: phosphatidylserine decarboxylase [Pyrinomonadaceae bacterium]|jgi:phosphatidylserine decarboxylase|nr:phosphatidylserine decarboxylase [Pyrinomonadaceae bacterium]
MNREGYVWTLAPLLAALAVGALGLAWVSVPLLVLAGVLLQLACFMAYFFRDPERAAPGERTVIVSPADGRVTLVGKLSPEDANSPKIVSIFLSPLDVHINRSPISGTILDVTYTKGRFKPATSDTASLVNEQNALTIQGEGVTVVCKQIAGVLARRIVCWKKPGDRLELGERFGLIKFGSRTDLVMPPEVEVLVSTGERVRGGVTVIGRF